MNEQLLELMGRFKTIIHDDLSLEMKQYAEDFDVPIIQDQGLELMLQLLRIKQPKAILEIVEPGKEWVTLLITWFK